VALAAITGFTAAAQNQNGSAAKLTEADELKGEQQGERHSQQCPQQYQPMHATFFGQCRLIFGTDDRICPEMKASLARGPAFCGTVVASLAWHFRKCEFPGT
jgi:hypothetical protein